MYTTNDKEENRLCKLCKIKVYITDGKKKSSESRKVQLDKEHYLSE